MLWQILIHTLIFIVQDAYSQLNFFDEKQIYWTPALTIVDLYSQLASKKYREISREQIQLAADNPHNVNPCLA